MTLQSRITGEAGLKRVSGLSQLFFWVDNRGNITTIIAEIADALVVAGGIR